MKIYECEMQLKRVVDKYNKLSEINKIIADQFPYRTDNFDSYKFARILDQIHASFNVIPINLSEQIESYFNNLTDEINNEIVFIEDYIKDFNNTFNDVSISSFAAKSLTKLDQAKNEEDCIIKLVILLNFISYNKIKFENTARKSIDLKSIMKNAVLPSRKIIVDYMFSLELPTVGDYDL